MRKEIRKLKIRSAEIRKQREQAIENEEDNLKMYVKDYFYRNEEQIVKFVNGRIMNAMMENKSYCYLDTNSWADMVILDGKKRYGAFTIFKPYIERCLANEINKVFNPKGFKIVDIFCRKDEENFEPFVPLSTPVDLPFIFWNIPIFVFRKFL